MDFVNGPTVATPGNSEVMKISLLLAIFHYTETRDRTDYKLPFYHEGFRV